MKLLREKLGCGVGAQRLPDRGVWIYKLRICECCGGDPGPTGIATQKH